MLANTAACLLLVSQKQHQTSPFTTLLQLVKKL